MKHFASDQVFNWCPVTVHAQVEVQHLFPHRRKEAQMPLLPRVLLRDLQFDAFVGFLQPAEKRRYWLACLKVDGAVLGLDDDVGVELPVERMENVVSSSGAVILGVLPIQVMVIHEGPIKKNAAMRLERAGNDVGRVSRCPAVGGWTGTPLGICLDHKPTEVRNLPVDLVGLCPPPFDHPGIERIEAV